MDKVSMSNFFTFSRYQTKCVTNIFFRQIDDAINFNIYLRSASKAMADRDKKRGRKKWKKLNIFRTKRAF